MNIHRIARAALTAGVMLVLLAAGCEFKKPEEKVRERAEMLLQARIDGKWDQVYDLYDADYKWVTEILVEEANTFAEGRIVSLLEGGYVMPALGRAASGHIRAMMGI